MFSFRTFQSNLPSGKARLMPTVRMRDRPLEMALPASSGGLASELRMLTLPCVNCVVTIQAVMPDEDPMTAAAHEQGADVCEWSAWPGMLKEESNNHTHR